jgi:putative transport protein
MGCVTVIALVAVTTGALATVGLALFLGLPDELAAGLYTGALTCTPALAAAVDVVERSLPGGSIPVSVGYGIAYPFSMIGVVLLIQFLPRLTRRLISAEEARWLEDRQVETPALEARQYRISNPNCAVNGLVPIPTTVVK